MPSSNWRAYFFFRRKVFRPRLPLPIKDLDGDYKADVQGKLTFNGVTRPFKLRFSIPQVHGQQYLRARSLRAERWAPESALWREQQPRAGIQARNQMGYSGGMMNQGRLSVSVASADGETLTP